jgi:signal transduction histidine kinase
VDLPAEFNLLLRGLLHELRNPLSSILTAANLVGDTARENADVDEETEMLLGVIKKESLRLNRILTEFSHFIKLPEPRPALFDLAQLARDATAQLQDEGVLVPSVRVVDDLPESCPVWADQGQMRTALHHVLRNAGEAMPEGGALRMALAQGDNLSMAVLCIGDSGAGFSEESRTRAFEPFYSTKLHATGLGLAAACAILKAAGGRAWLGAQEESTSVIDSGKTESNRVPVQICLEVPRAEAATQIHN